MKFRFAKRSKASDSFRVSSIMGKYDVDSRDIVERFEGNIELDKVDGWKVGLIYGKSGTGKSLIARQLWPDSVVKAHLHNSPSVLDDFPQHATSDDIARTLHSVGFASVTSWLKPYRVLSNGEKMRVDLAMGLLDKRELIVFDEFTSVIDRHIARVGSFAVSKAVRRSSKRFIAVTCHEDVAQWLEPDWHFCTDDMVFTYSRRSLRRPEMSFRVAEGSGLWPLFSKYHYLNSNLLGGSEQYVTLYKGQPVAFCAVTHVVHRVRGMKRIHRLVVLPDFQGIGLGFKLLNWVARRYVDRGHKMFIRTSNPSLIYAMEKHDSWALRSSAGRNAPHAGDEKLRARGARSRLTTGWEFMR